MFFNIVKIYQSTQAVLNLAVFQSSFLGTFIKYYKISQLIHTQSIAN